MTRTTEIGTINKNLLIFRLHRDMCKRKCSERNRYGAIFFLVQSSEDFESILLLLTNSMTFGHRLSLSYTTSFRFTIPNNTLPNPFRSQPNIRFWAWHVAFTLEAPPHSKDAILGHRHKFSRLFRIRIIWLKIRIQFLE